MGLLTISPRCGVDNCCKILVERDTKSGRISAVIDSPILKPRGKVPSRWIWVPAVGIVLLALLVGVNLGRWRDRLFGRAGSRPVESLAVLPLANLSGDATQDYFADGMTEALITDMSKISALRVISRTSVMHYKGTQRTLPEIARELNVDAVVEGSVLRSGDRVRITAQLIEGSTDRHLWSNSYERDLRDVLALQSDVASAIAKEIQVNLTPGEQVRLASSAPVDPEAHEAYLKGLFYFNEGATSSPAQALRSRSSKESSISSKRSRLIRSMRWPIPGWLGHIIGLRGTDQTFIQSRRKRPRRLYKLTTQLLKRMLRSPT